MCEAFFFVTGSEIISGRAKQFWGVEESCCCWKPCGIKSIWEAQKWSSCCELRLQSPSEICSASCSLFCLPCSRANKELKSNVKVMGSFIFFSRRNRLSLFPPMPSTCYIWQLFSFWVHEWKFLQEKLGFRPQIHVRRLLNSAKLTTNERQFYFAD